MTQSFDPNALVRTTNTFQVEMVVRAADGEIINVKSWLPTLTMGDLHALRPKLRLRNSAELFLCFCCGHEVLLRKHMQGGHFFAHKEKTSAERSHCIYQQDHVISEADRDRIRYHGQREGERHKKAKALIARVIAADSNFSPPEIEKTWTTFEDGWRRPDVSSTWHDQRIVFEAQISNTYPQVVAERTSFYQQQGALLIWVFDRQPEEKEWRTLHADTFCSNDQQMFVVDEECASVSESTGHAHFKIYSLRPDVAASRNSSEERWYLIEKPVENYCLVEFSGISLNQQLQKATLFDLAEEKARATHKVLCVNVQIDKKTDLLNVAIKDRLERKKDVNHKKLESWAALVCAIESIKHGLPIGTKFNNNYEIFNMIYDHYFDFIGPLMSDFKVPAEHLGQPRQ